MRILLLRDAFTSASPPGAMTFFPQVVRQARNAGRPLHELVSHPTASGKSLEAFCRQMRRQLDDEVAAFDPQVIQVQGFGALGHLALETGVPYLIASWGEEIAACQGNPQLHNYAQQSAENAGRIVLDNRTTLLRASAAFGDAALTDPADRVICLTDVGWPGDWAESDAESALPALDYWLWNAYRQLIMQRRGHLDG